MHWTRRDTVVAGVLGLIGSAGPGLAQETGAIRGTRLEGGRLTVPVLIDGRGPFHFAVDSAANASVIADDLARTLGLPDDGTVAMHTLIAREVVPTVRAGRFETGALGQDGVRLALASRLGLDGTDGLIGTDLLAGLRLDLDFRRGQRARVTRSRRSGDRFFDARPRSARLIRAVEQRFGELLMIEVRAAGINAYAIIDTGAQATIINTALARAAFTLPITLRDGTGRARVQSPTGRSAPAEAMMLDSLRLGGLGLGQLPVLAGDFHTFDVWGLADRPAMLMGVDVFGLFEAVAIDLKRGEVVFFS